MSTVLKGLTIVLLLIGAIMMLSGVSTLIQNKPIQVSGTPATTMSALLAGLLTMSFGTIFLGSSYVSYKLSQTS